MFASFIARSQRPAEFSHSLSKPGLFCRGFIAVHVYPLQAVTILMSHCVSFHSAVTLSSFNLPQDNA